MSTRNPWLKFQRLIDTDSRTVVTVVANNGDGTSTVETRYSSQVTAQGEGVAAGNKAMMVGREIRYQVPDLNSSIVEV